MDLQKMVQGYITAQIANKIGKKFNLSPKQTKALMAVAVPLILGAMAKNAKKDKKQAASLVDAIQNDHDGSIFDQLDTLGSSAEKKDGAKILQHVLGSKEHDITAMLAGSNGIEQSQAGDVLRTLAPLVMGALGKEQSEKALGADDLQDLFTGQQKTSSQQSGHNPLLDLLDQDGDGSSTDDMLRIGMNMFKRLNK